MRYRLARSFPDAHSQGVTQVAFAPSGTLLATSDLAGKLCVWNAWTGNLLHYYTPGTSILSLAWVSADTILCGLGDGSIVTLQLGDAEARVIGSWCHAFPVEHLALSGKRLASGAHSELYIWKVGEKDEHSALERELGQPVTSDGQEVIVTGLHWTSGTGHGARVLIATYMSHGIFIFESKNWTVLRKIGDNAPGVMARSSLSPDGSRIAVSNLVYGFDIYDTKTGALVITVSHKFGKEYPIPVAFLHGGQAIIGGSTLGAIRIWYIDGSLSRKMQTLSVAGGNHVLALAAHYSTQADQFLIAAGVMDGKSSVTLWKAEEGRYADSRRPGIDYGRLRTLWNFAVYALLALRARILIVLATLGCLAVYYYLFAAGGLGAATESGRSFRVAL